MRPSRQLLFRTLFLAWGAFLAARAEETILPDPDQVPGTPTPSGSSLSKPEAAPGENPSPGPGENSKPSQGEGEKAPAADRPAAVPDFSLPEVVITGENELTIGASRLDRKESDVTIGSHDLTGVERAINDLPGLSKTFTALTAEEAGPSKGTALILHGGAGSPGVYGGWGLFGQEFKGFQYLLKGRYSAWGGESAGAGRDGDRRYGFGADLRVLPSAPLNFRLSGNASVLDAESPFQGSQRELHQGADLQASAQWKVSGLLAAEAVVTDQPSLFNEGPGGDRWTNELEGRLRLTAEDLDPHLEQAEFELGGRKAASDMSAPLPGYDWGWATLRGLFKSGEDLSLGLRVQAQAGSGSALPLALYPGADLTWRFFGQSQVNLYWRTDRFLDNLHDLLMDNEHVLPGSGFPSPTEVQAEFGGRFTQKITERVLLSLSASRADLGGYHQWTDLSPLVPSFLQTYSTLSFVRITKAGANVQWGFLKDWQAALSYQWTQGENRSGDGSNLTALPTHRGALSLYRGDDKWEARLDLQAQSERQAFQSLAGALPAFFTLGLDATYHLDKSLSLWLNGDNLLGREYQIQPGYNEPRFHLRGGLEIVL